MASAVARRSWPFIGGWPRQRSVSPFAGETIGTCEKLPSHHHTATASGTEDDAEDDLSSDSRAIRRLADGKAVCVVRATHVARESVAEIALQRLAIEPGRIRILHEACRCNNRAGNSNADGALHADLALEAVNNFGDRSNC